MNKKAGIITAVVGGVIVLGGAAAGYQLYFQGHFKPGTQVLGHKVGFKSVSEAEQILNQSSKTPVTIDLQENGKTIHQLQLENRAGMVTRHDLKRALHGDKVTVKLTTADKTALQQKIDTLNVNQGRHIQMTSKLVYDKGANQFKLAKNTGDQFIDLGRLQTLIQNDWVQGKTSYKIDVQKAYKASENNTKALKQQLTAMNKAEANQEIVVSNGKKTVNFTREQLATVINDDGQVDQKALTELVTDTIGTQLDDYEPVLWKNPSDGHTYQYINNQNYGYELDIPETVNAITKAVQGNQEGQTIQAKMVPTFAGGIEKVIQKNFVWVDTDAQTAEIWVNGQMIDKADTLAGFWDKRTATVSGFNTMSYKTAFIQMKGEEPNASGGWDKYSVPIHYAEQLLYRPYNSPTTGNHTGPYATGIFIHQAGTEDGDKPEAWFTDKSDMQARPLGVSSNGCIGLPPADAKIFYDNMTPGFPVIVTGHYYDNAPNEFDKPVDYGKLVN